MYYWPRSQNTNTIVITTNCVKSYEFRVSNSSLPRRRPDILPLPVPPQIRNYNLGQFFNLSTSDLERVPPWYEESQSIYTQSESVFKIYIWSFLARMFANNRTSKSKKTLGLYSLLLILICHQHGYL